MMFETILLSMLSIAGLGVYLIGFMLVMFFLAWQGDSLFDNYWGWHPWRGRPKVLVLCLFWPITVLVAVCIDQWGTYKREQKRKAK